MRRPLTLSAALTAAALAVPGAAVAQLPAPAQPVAPTSPPPAGSIKISTAGGVATKKLRYYARGDRVTVRGTVRPFVAGQVAVLQVIRKGKVIKRIQAPIRPGKRGTGRVAFRHKAGKTGMLRFRARHNATPQLAAFQSKSKRVKVGSWRAGEGAKGTHVLLLQRQLQNLGYAVPINGRYDAGTSRAVLAFRKVNGMARNGYADRRIFSMAFRGKGAFKLRHPKAGKHIEFDWSRQVLVLAKGGKAWRTYHTSSGAPATPTVFGKYKFYRKQPGTNAKGMVESSYFIRGYAIHGYVSVPNYPASHGCLRVPIPNARQIYDWVPLGMTIFTYR